MRLSEFDYKLPVELIAQSPIEPRDYSRLLVLNKRSGKIEHHSFYEVLDYLKAGDVLVVNNSKVFPARIFGKRVDTGGKVELLLHKATEDSTWEVIGKNLKPNTEVEFDNSSLKGFVKEKHDERYIIEFNIKGEDFFKKIEKIGQTPLPPYIKKKADNKDKKSYQTIYAKDRGSVAAPTAGLHFTENLLKKVREKGVVIAEVTLHVGLGTFTPVKTEEIKDHKIHSEYYSVKKEEIEKIIEAKKNGRRIIAVGTTTTRVLETIFSKNKKLTTDLLTTDNLLSGWTNIFIYPGYKFKCVDGLITNFHLPKSTLLMLISAFAGREKISLAYKEAISKKYRFFSYGDAMLIIED
ncbi:MAG: tRNA preQ1(34) S-adenosylmethionine ribosyltransferase-isomerase QueA [Patescibacteria group bacterium]|nr:tRNA preQ1(34) S-adenosylmethionine ribosyltransferase-isomerase QueA [Patescibacteria group bacterium]